MRYRQHPGKCSGQHSVIRGTCRWPIIRSFKIVRKYKKKSNIKKKRKSANDYLTHTTSKKSIVFPAAFVYNKGNKTAADKEGSDESGKAYHKGQRVLGSFRG